MPNYNQAHAFYAGVDLHARSMLVHIQSATLHRRCATLWPRAAPWVIRNRKI